MALEVYGNELKLPVVLTTAVMAFLVSFECENNVQVALFSSIGMN